MTGTCHGFLLPRDAQRFCSHANDEPQCRHASTCNPPPPPKKKYLVIEQAYFVCGDGCARFPRQRIWLPESPRKTCKHVAIFTNDTPSFTTMQCYPSCRKRSTLLVGLVCSSGELMKPADDQRRDANPVFFKDINQVLTNATWSSMVWYPAWIVGFQQPVVHAFTLCYMMPFREWHGRQKPSQRLRHQLCRQQS